MTGLTSTDPRGPGAGPDGMVWIPGGTFQMGSDHHYAEEAPAHPVTVDGFWIDPHPVTNAEFARFVRATGHVTVAERPADPARYPGARPELLMPASSVSSLSVGTCTSCSTVFSYSARRATAGSTRVARRAGR